jgi:hypothetical protein
MTVTIPIHYELVGVAGLWFLVIILKTIREIVF